VTAEHNPYEAWSDDLLDREQRVVEVQIKKLMAELSVARKKEYNIRLTKQLRRADVHLAAANAFGIKEE
jgi:hypothetical protein